MPPKALPSSHSVEPSIVVGVLTIVLAVVVCYRPSLRGDLILDDDILLTANRLIRSPHGLSRIWFSLDSIDYWPLTNTSLWLEWRLWGMNPAGYRLTNLALHFVTCALVWRILRRLSVPGAFAATLLFAVHPVNVESVAWVAQRKTLLASLFVLLSVHFHLRAGEGRHRIRSVDGYGWTRDHSLSLAMFVLAMLSKTSAVVLPVLLLGLIGWKRRVTRADLLRTVPFWLVAGILGIVSIWFQAHGFDRSIRNLGALDRILGAAAAVWFYLGKALWPLDLSLIYPQWNVRSDEWRWWVPAVSMGVVSAALWRWRRGYGRALLFTWGYFCIALIPVLGLIDVAFMAHAWVADHYQHLALLGPVTLIAATWAQLVARADGPRRAAIIALAVITLAVLGSLSVRQSRLYADAVTLYTHTVERNPSSWLAQNNLGSALYAAGRPAEAVLHCRQAVQLDPSSAKAHSNLSSALRETGRLGEAIAEGETALRLRPHFAEAHNNLGAALLDAGRVDEAILHFERSIAIDPELANAHNNLGIALGRAGRVNEAIRQFDTALRLDPVHPDAAFNRDVAVGMRNAAVVERESLR